MAAKRATSEAPDVPQEPGAELADVPKGRLHQGVRDHARLHARRAVFPRGAEGDVDGRGGGEGGGYRGT